MKDSPTPVTNAHKNAAGATEYGAEIDAELQPYLGGSKQPPIPTYFIGAFGRGSVTALEALQQSETSSSGLTYLGRSGLQSVHGLNVAVLDGTYSSLEYREGVPGHGSAACRHFTQVTHCSSHHRHVTPGVHISPYHCSRRVHVASHRHSLSAISCCTSSACSHKCCWKPHRQQYRALTYCSDEACR